MKSILCGRMHSYTASASLLLFLCVFFFPFVFLSLVRAPESRVSWGSGFHGCGEVCSGGRCKEGCVFQKSRAVWSVV